MEDQQKIIDFFEKTLNVDPQNQFVDRLYDFIKESNEPSYVVMSAIGLIAALYLIRYQDKDKQLESFTRFIESEMGELSMIGST